MEARTPETTYARAAADDPADPTLPMVRRLLASGEVSAWIYTTEFFADLACLARRVTSMLEESTTRL